jgi:hypothetical protein
LQKYKDKREIKVGKVLEKLRNRNIYRNASKKKLKILEILFSNYFKLFFHFSLNYISITIHDSIKERNAPSLRNLDNAYKNNKYYFLSLSQNPKNVCKDTIKLVP